MIPHCGDEAWLWLTQWMVEVWLVEVEEGGLVVTSLSPTV